MAADPELRLGTLLQLEAERAGHSREWRSYLAGRLLVPEEAISFRMLAEAVPRDEPTATATAARHGMDAELLWLVVKSALTWVESPRTAP